MGRGHGRVFQVRWIRVITALKIISLFTFASSNVYYMAFSNSDFWYLVKKNICTVFLLLVILSFFQNVRVLSCVSVLLIRRYIQEVRAKKSKYKTLLNKHLPRVYNLQICMRLDRIGQEQKEAGTQLIKCKYLQIFIYSVFKVCTNTNCNIIFVTRCFDLVIHLG